MSSAGPHESSGTTWFVVASFGHNDDESARCPLEGEAVIHRPPFQSCAALRLVCSLS
jgi:5-methylcytosine-specific restriction enzyme B